MSEKEKNIQLNDPENVFATSLENWKGSKKVENYGTGSPRYPSRSGVNFTKVLRAPFTYVS
jgi:hypothetical protein